MNQLRSKRPDLFELVVAFGVFDLFLGFCIFLLPHSVFTQTQNYVITTIGKSILANLLIAKGLAILFICLRTTRLSTIRFFLMFGMAFWIVMSLVSIIGMVRGTGTSVIGAGFCIFMAWMRWWIVRKTA